MVNDDGGEPHGGDPLDGFGVEFLERHFPERLGFQREVGSDASAGGRPAW